MRDKWPSAAIGDSRFAVTPTKKICRQIRFFKFALCKLPQAEALLALFGRNDPAWGKSEAEN